MSRNIKEPWAYASGDHMFPGAGGIVDGREAAIREGRTIERARELCVAHREKFGGKLYRLVIR